MANDPNAQEKLRDDPLAVFDDWAQEADQRAYAELGDASAEFSRNLTAPHSA